MGQPTEGATCPLCKGTRSEKRFADNGYDVRQCAVCDLFFIDPFPVSADAQHERVREYTYDDLAVADADKHYRAEVVYYAEHAEAVRAEVRGASSILDVGCGTGRLLELLGADAGLRRAGIELNSGRAAWARQHAGCEIHQVPVEDFASTDRFDVITMMNVLSHIPSFEGLFSSVRRLLTPGGKFILKTGELESNVRHGDVFDWGVPDHLHFMGMRTAEAAARQYGFTVVRHDRAPLTRELFSKTRWRMPGRSRARDAVKAVVAHTPLALRMLAALYAWRHGCRVWTATVVLKVAS